LDQELAAMPNPSPIIPMPTASTEEPVVVRRKPGRPKKLRPRPSADQAEYERAVAEARQRAMAEDHLLGLLRSERPNPAAVLHAVSVETAREQAALLWDRMRVEERNGDAQRISSRRIEALSKLAALVLERRKLGISEDDDIRGEPFARVEQLWIDMLREVARDVLPTETGTLAMDRVVAAMKAWRASLAESGRSSVPQP